MDGLSNVNAVGAEFAADGKTWKLEPFTLELWGELEKHIQTLRPNPVLATAAILDLVADKYKQELIAAAMHEAAMARPVSMQETQQFLLGRDGLAWSLWRCGQKNHPELATLDDARQVVVKLGSNLLLLMDAILKVTGLNALTAALKNSASPTQATGTEARGASGSLGPKSSDT